MYIMNIWCFFKRAEFSLSSLCIYNVDIKNSLTIQTFVTKYFLFFFIEKPISVNKVKPSLLK